MIASLAMYDFPWLQQENDALWAALRGRLGDAAPAFLDRDRHVSDIWRDPSLLLAQTCGYPLMTELRGVVRLVATPVYDLPGCDGPFHRSFIVVRADDPACSVAALRGRRAAVNGWNSNSGMNLLRASVAPFATGGRFFSEVVVTGAHLASVAAIRDGRADVAAIDCVTHGLAARYRPELLAGTRVLAPTVPTASLPFVTASDASDAQVEALREALRAVLPWPSLNLAGVAALSEADYARVVDIEREAEEAGYPAVN